MDTSPPLVSVVIPTHDRADLLEGAVLSVLGQTHEHLELWVVDDASEDATPELLARLEAEHHRLRGLRLDRSAGAAGARNAGIHRARGEVVAFLDDDSRWAPGKLERQLAALDREHGAVVCRKRVQLEDGRWFVEGGTGSGHPMEALLGFPTSTFLVLRDLLEEVGGFDETLPRLHDWELLVRLSRVTHVADVPEVLVDGVMVEGGITLTKGPLVEAAYRIVERHHRELDAAERGLLRYLLGKFLLVDGHSAEARRFMTAALRNDPWVPRYWAGLAASLLSPAPARWVRDARRLASRHSRGG